MPSITKIRSNRNIDNEELKAGLGSDDGLLKRCSGIVRGDFDRRSGLRVKDPMESALPLFVVLHLFQGFL